MSKEQEKGQTPAYGSYKTLTSFMNDVREQGHVPLRVDRSEMTKFSGSAVTDTIATLRFFGLVKGEKADTTPLFEKFAMATDEERKAILADMMRDAYAFVLNAEGIDIKRATANQVHDLFRARGANGSTLVRAVAFFVSATKEAGIKISPSIKPPPKPRPTNGGKKKKDVEIPPVDKDEGKKDIPPPPGLHRFELPIPGKPSVQVLVPDNMDAADWEMLSQMFGIYVNRWKGYKPPTSKPAGEGAS